MLNNQSPLAQTPAWTSTCHIKFSPYTQSTYIFLDVSLVSWNEDVKPSTLPQNRPFSFSMKTLPLMLGDRLRKGKCQLKWGNAKESCSEAVWAWWGTPGDGISLSARRRPIREGKICGAMKSHKWHVYSTQLQHFQVKGLRFRVGNNENRGCPTGVYFVQYLLINTTTQQS